MRWLVLAVLVVLVGCGARSSSGPAWPKQQAREVDGGESLAPRQPRVAAAVADASAVPGEDAKPAAAVPGATPATPTATPAAGTAPAAATPDEPITTEEIVIEINDD